MGQSEVAQLYVTLCSQLRLPRSLPVGDRYATQHPFDGSLGEVQVKSLGDGPATTGSTTIWIPRLGDLFEHQARELSLKRRGESKSWYRAAALRAVAHACERYPDAPAEEAAVRMLLETRRA